MLDFKGREMMNWAGSVLIEDSGECCLVVSGQPEYRHDLLVREARRRDLAEGKDLAGSLQQGELDVWSFQGKPGTFQLLEVDKRGEALAADLRAAGEEGRAADRATGRPA